MKNQKQNNLTLVNDGIFPIKYNAAGERINNELDTGLNEIFLKIN